MTENKRFTNDRWQIYDNGKILSVSETEKLLNKLHDENEQLKRQIGNLEHTRDFCDEVCADCERLEKENEQLKNDATVLICSNQEYRKENEQLKQTMKEVKDLLIEEVDVFSDKAIEHDVFAYKELQELDNKDAFYIADATKKAIQMLKELEE